MAVPDNEPTISADIIVTLEEIGAALHRLDEQVTFIGQALETHLRQHAPTADAGDSGVGQTGRFADGAE